MKAFALILLSALVAVQGRSSLTSQRSVAELGEYPFVVHLRIAVSTSGFLESSVGSLIDNRWVLTTARELVNSRFVWLRYGAINVINPSLVTESSAVRIHESFDASTGANNIALVSINRYVEATANIAPISLSTSSELPSLATLCGYGANGDAPGDLLSCFEVTLDSDEEGPTTASGDGEITKFDVGTPVFADSVQVGLIVAGNGESGVVELIAPYLSWIESESGVELSRKVQSDEGLKVHFIN